MGNFPQQGIGGLWRCPGHYLGSSRHSLRGSGKSLRSPCKSLSRLSGGHSSLRSPRGCHPSLWLSANWITDLTTQLARLCIAEVPRTETGQDSSRPIVRDIPLDAIVRRQQGVLDRTQEDTGGETLTQGGCLRI